MFKKSLSHPLFISLMMIMFFGCSSKNTHDTYSGSTAEEAPTGTQPKSIQFWWPDMLDLQPLRQHSKESNPLGQNFNYAKEFAKVDIKTLKKDIEKVMLTSQDWWPADWGNYGPFFIRMAWHATGTYRVTDGRGGAGGGQQRFEPLNSWPDNANLDKARRLLWPVKKKYGKKVSWADLIVLTGNVAMESMGFKTMGFAGGRLDDWEADLVYWGPENKMLEDHHMRYKGKGKNRKLKKPLGAAHMGLIYVNPEGPGGNHNPMDSAQDIRETFGRMAMNDEETLALVAGGHTFGKAHGAHKPEDCVGAEPAAAGLEEQGLGWKNKCGTGKGKDTTTSGIEGAWTAAPTKWTHLYLSTLLNNEWEKVKSPAGATQWIPKDGKMAGDVPPTHPGAKASTPMMTTADMALKVDPEYRKIADRFLADPQEFEKAFAKAWFKLTHRDMGPRSRYVGSDATTEVMLWQDALPKANYKSISSSDVSNLKNKILNSGLSVSDLVKTAWASAASYRNTDMRGGANGARLALAPQKDWAINKALNTENTIAKLKEIKNSFNKSIGGGKKVSLADLIVIAGAAGIEKAAKDAGNTIKINVKLGRTDSTQEQTDVKSFAFLEPKADAFINYYSEESQMPPLKMMIDKASLLGLTIPEMTVLIGGMRVLGANSNGVKHGYFTNKVGTLSNDYFTNILDMSTAWRKSSTEGLYEGVDRKNQNVKWTATPVDLIFGSHSELRAVAEVYAADDGNEKFLKDFSKAWSKVMSNDRFDLK